MSASKDDSGPVTPRTFRGVERVDVSVEEVGNGRRDITTTEARPLPDDRPFHQPRNAAEIAANCASEAKAAALFSSGMAGEALGASRAALKAVEGLTVRFGNQEAALVRLETKMNGARRTYSGSFAPSSPPPPPPEPIKIPTRTAMHGDTGEHQIISDEAVADLAAKYDELRMQVSQANERALIAEAEERGAQEMIAQLETEKAAKEKAEKDRASDARSLWKSRRETALFVIAAFGAAYGLFSWLLPHIH
jgi:hypothetical protein